MAYRNTLITIAEDSPVEASETPTTNRVKTPGHMIEFALLTERPYTYDHEGLTFEVYLRKNDLKAEGKERQELWNQLFSKGHPCLRASALTKRYGYGAHYNEEGKIALYPVESEEYAMLMRDAAVTKIPAMKRKR